MTTADEWRDLARKCREATGPDREIDLTFAEALYASGSTPVNYATEIWLERNGGWTDSIDAIVALIEETLPDLVYVLSFIKGGKGQIKNAWFYEAGEDIYEKEYGPECSSPALALCVAYCEARAAVEDAARAPMNEADD